MNLRSGRSNSSEKRIGNCPAFIYLQLLDLLTTLSRVQIGASEASPFIRMLMHAGPVAGVAVSKLVALALGGLCVYLKKQHLIRWATYWYSGLVVWNLMIVLAAAGPRG